MFLSKQNGWRNLDQHVMRFSQSRHAILPDIILRYICPLDIANTWFSLAISSFSISVDRQLLQYWTEFRFLFNCWLPEMFYCCSHSAYFCFYICNSHRIPILQEMQTSAMFKRMAGSSGKTINFSCQNHSTIFAFLSVDLITARDELSVYRRFS